jgi:hypothetical protein
MNNLEMGCIKRQIKDCPEYLKGETKNVIKSIIRFPLRHETSSVPLFTEDELETLGFIRQNQLEEMDGKSAKEWLITNGIDLRNIIERFYALEYIAAIGSLKRLEINRILGKCTHQKIDLAKAEINASFFVYERTEEKIATQQIMHINKDAGLTRLQIMNVRRKIEYFFRTRGDF